MLIKIGKGGFSKQQKQIAYLPKKSYQNHLWLLLIYPFYHLKKVK